MIIKEVCPKCGADIIPEMICTNPPIPVRRCMKCNWYWEGKQEEVLRVPFNPDGYDMNLQKPATISATDYAGINVE